MISSALFCLWTVVVRRDSVEKEAKTGEKDSQESFSQKEGKEVWVVTGNVNDVGS